MINMPNQHPTRDQQSEVADKTGMGPLTVLWHDDVLNHDTGRGFWDQPSHPLFEVSEPHPENADRLRNMRSVLLRGPIAEYLRWKPGRHATLDELKSVHDAEYVDRIAATLRAGHGRLGMDESTVISPGSWNAALAAAGSSIAAVETILDGEARISLALVRPPGHHAQPAQDDGYCFFNNAALAAQRARDRGRERVAIVDWDVHHGNGNQACFYNRSDVLTISLHMRTGLWGESHPQTGSPEEVGHGRGQGYNVNIELPAGSGDQAYGLAMKNIVAPILRQYEPDMIVGSCGQDASTFDGNGRQNVSMDGFRYIGRVVGEVAHELCRGNLALVQEGGYARTYSALCLHATLEGILGFEEPMLDEGMAYIPDDYARARESVDNVRSALSRYWDLDLDGVPSTRPLNKVANKSA